MCGFSSDPVKECRCSPREVARYRKRISGPLMDRIDLFVEVPRVEYEKLMQPASAETSSQIRRRVEKAREVQQARFKGTDIITNADMGPEEVWQFCKIDESAEGLLRTASGQMHLSARAFHRILKVSRTLADLALSETITIAHVAEALQYRQKNLDGSG
jgi:magnesium chelatase family protein